MLDDLDNMLDEAITAHEAKDFNSAAAKYTKILERDAHHADANHNFGLLTVELGLKDEALIFLQTAINTNPKVLKYWVTFIDTLTKAERFDDARSVLEQAYLFGYTEEVFDQLRHNLDLKQRLCEPLIKLDHANTTETVLDQVDQKLGVLNEPITDRQKSEKDEIGILGELKLDQALKLAKKKIKDGDYEEAKVIYEDILKKFSKNKKALDGLKSLSNQPDTKKPTIQEPPIDQLHGLVKFYTKGQFKQAQFQASELLKQYPRSVILYNILGASNHGLGELDDAIDAYKKALSIQPDYAEACKNMGLTLQEQIKLDEAIQAFNKAVAIKPDYAEAYYNMGNVLKQQGKLEEAIEAYNKALSIKPNYADAYNNMGNALKQQSKLEEAVEAYKKALSIKPDYADAYNNMGIALQEQGKLDEALEAFNKAVSIKPDYADAYNNMGNALEQQSKLEEAVEAYKKALSIKPDYADAYNNMGIALKEQGKLEEAIEAYKQALAIKPNYADAYNNMGNALEEQGKPEKAIQACNKAISIKPDYADAYSNMGNALKQQGKLEEAIEAYNKALFIKPDYADAYNNMGNAFREQNKLDDAIKAYNKALAIKPDYVEAARSLVELPIGSIDAEIILGLNKEFEKLCSKIENKSTRLFFEANLLSHNRKYDDAFRVFVDANRIKSNDIASSVKYLTQRYHLVTERIQRWSPNFQKKDDFSAKKLFLLGPSRSGKSSLEQLLISTPLVYPIFEHINLKAVGEKDTENANPSILDMSEIFYHNEQVLLDSGNNLITSTSPDSIFYIDHLLDDFDNSFFVLIKRDQIDIAAEIFKTEYRKGNFYSYAHSSIQEYLNTYTTIWEEVKRKAPRRTIEIDYEDILMKPQKVVEKISQFTAVDFKLDFTQQHLFQKLTSPFREHYSQKFKS